VRCFVGLNCRSQSSAPARRGSVNSRGRRRARSDVPT